MLIRLPDGRSRARYAVIALGPVALLLLPFLVADAPALFNQLFGYQGVVDYGLLAIVEEVYRLALRQPLPLAGGVVLTVGKVIFGLMYAAVVFESWKQRRQPGMIFTIRAAALVFLAFYLVYPGISSQYLLWLLPFALALSTRSAIVYSAAAAAALVSYYAFHYPEILLNSVTRPGQPEALHILYIACLAGFWLACAWLLAQYNRLQPASPAESQQA
jgi:hypothetical protein